MTAADFAAAFAGAALAVAILWDAFETMLVPRRIGRRIRLTRYFYVLTWRAWRSFALRIRRPSRREAMLGFFGPISLILLLVCWASGLIIAFTLMQVAALDSARFGPTHFPTLLYMSGETFFTLGFGDVTPNSSWGRLLSVLEAGMGFGFLGMVVGYLPTMYGAFSQREIEISLLDARAGSPPTAAEFLGRLPGEGAAALSDEMLREWERWAAQLLETHISYPQLAYYRSQHSNQSWLGALTSILDSSALIVAGLDALPARQAKLTFAMARHALVDITQIFVTGAAPPTGERLASPRFESLRLSLSGRGARLPEGAEYEARLATLRRMYEPYALALAEYLVVELPPWIHDSPRRDNWQGGPWDRRLAEHAARPHVADEHF